MVRVAATLVLAVVSGGCLSEAAEFERVMGGPQLDRGVFTSTTEDGGFIVAGVTKSEGAGDEDVYLVKFDATGTPAWSRTFGGSGADDGWCVREVREGYAIAGFTSSEGAGGFDFYLLSTDREGTLQWSKTYGGEADDRCWGLLTTADGGYALVGETLSSGAGEEDCLLVRTDAAGNKVWSRTYGGEQGDRCFSIAGTDDGGFLLAGQTYSQGAGDRDVLVIKTDAEGTEEWSRTFGGPASDVGHSVGRTDDGHFIVVGYTASFAGSGDDPYLIKIDSQGDTLWTRVLHLPGVSHTITGEQARDGGYYLVGFRNDPAEGSSAALLVRANRSGHLEWSRDLFSTSAGQSMGYTVRATADGGCVFTGHTTEGAAGDLDLLLVKVDRQRR